MTTENKTVKSVEKVFSDIKEQTIEADLILPDYYPEISKILKCSFEPVTESVSRTADKVTISGSAEITLIFADADKNISVFETQTKYTKTMPCQEISENDDIEVTQTAESINFKAVAPRRVEIHANASVKLEIRRQNEFEIFSGAEDRHLQLREKEIEYMEPACICNKAITVSDSVSMPDMQDKIEVIVRRESRAVLTEYKAIKNKLMLKGSCDIKLIYLEKESRAVKSLNYSFPFTEVTDAFGLTDDAKCSINLYAKDTFVSVKDNGGKCALDTNVKLHVFLVAADTKKCTYAEDAFSLVSKADCSCAPVPFIKSVNESSADFNFSFTAESYVEKPQTVCDVYGDNIKYSVIKDDKGQCLSYSLVLNAFLLCEDNSYVLVSRSYAGEHRLSANESVMLSSSLTVNSVSAIIKNDGCIEFNVDMKFVFLSCEKESRTMLTNVSVETANMKREEKLVLYYGSAGEEVWNIAKDNLCSTESIKSLNGIEEEKLSHDMLLVLQN